MNAITQNFIGGRSVSPLGTERIEVSSPYSGELIGSVSVAAMKGEVTTPAWKSKPSRYIIAANDRAISPILEAAQAKRIGATTTPVPSSHVIMLAQPATVAHVIIDVASKVGAK